MNPQEAFRALLDLIRDRFENPNDVKDFSRRFDELKLIVLDDGPVQSAELPAGAQGTGNTQQV